MKCLYVGYDFSEGKIGGNIVRKNNNEIIKEIFNNEVDDFFIKNDTRKIDLMKRFMTFSFNGGSKSIKGKFKEKLIREKYTHIFFDGSLFGQLVKYVKKQKPEIKVITFFHNVEFNYYKERVKLEGVHNSIALPSVRYNEALSFKYSDKLIVLNKREKLELEKNYGMKNMEIIPIFMRDKYNEKIQIKETDYNYLFIGTAFFANLHGISWFIENVLKNLPGKLLVIGRGMEILKNKYASGYEDKLSILGTVEDIEQYYYDDNIVISPIFYGAGMKTKTIEALMYNKKIVGTKEAFIGIEELEQYCCETKEEFIEAIQNTSYYNSRSIFLNNFSYEVCKKRMLEVIKN